MTNEEKKALRITATKIRMGIIEGTHAAKSGHPGGSLSSVELLTYLYFKEMKIDPKNPKWEERDRFVLSKGHAAPLLYSTLANRGFFPVEDLKTLRHVGSYLQGHPNMNLVPGVDMSTGSLGQGLAAADGGQGVSAACGMAKGFKFQNLPNRVYTLLGDGEIQEGEVWEAMMFAAHYQLDNLCVFVDNNNLQIDGEISKVMSPYPIDEKLKAFGFQVEVIDGQDFDQIEQAVAHAKATKGKPYAVVMKTIKGKDVSYMENQAAWHGKAPNDAEYEQAMAELSALLKKQEEE